jgi:hypothetical protein
MESLACLAYAKVFADNGLHQHFQTDAALEQFWRKPEHEIRLALGTVCDLTELKFGLGVLALQMMEIGRGGGDRKRCRMEFQGLTMTG